MSNENNNKQATQAIGGMTEEQISELADNVQAGDDSINKLKVQNLDFILDIPLNVSVELGRTKVIIKDLLQLGQGSVLELDKLAGEPLEVLVN
ncbi:MAG: FliM/FliN family flagellar motor switch protein, partial [Bacteriovoracia bacterium]